MGPLENLFPIPVRVSYPTRIYCFNNLIQKAIKINPLTNTFRTQSMAPGKGTGLFMPLLTGSSNRRSAAICCPSSNGGAEEKQPRRTLVGLAGRLHNSIFPFVCVYFLDTNDGDYFLN